MRAMALAALRGYSDTAIHLQQHHESGTCDALMRQTARLTHGKVPVHTCMLDMHHDTTPKVSMSASTYLLACLLRLSMLHLCSPFSPPVYIRNIQLAVCHGSWKHRWSSLPPQLVHKAWCNPCLAMQDCATVAVRPHLST